MPRALLSVEVPSIRRYVFGTDALREIRGASALLDEFNRKRMPNVVQNVAKEAQVVFTGGGTALFLLPADKAEIAVLELERDMRQFLGFVSLNTAVVEVPDDFGFEYDLQPGGYYQLLGARLVANKGVLPEVIGLPGNSLLRPCDSCGQNYGETEVTSPDGQLRILCGVCSRKWEKHYSLQQAFKRVGFDSDSSSSVWAELSDFLPGEILLDYQRPETTKELVEADGSISVKNNSLALIYADGDGLGTLLREAKNLSDIQKTSRGVHRAMLASVAAAIQGPLRPDPESKILPFDILLLGGDDLVLVTTAHRAFKTAMVLAETFPQESVRQALPRTLTLSMAIVFAHPHYPFRYMLDLADGCLRAAKRIRFQRQREQSYAPVAGLINYAFASDAPGGDYSAYEETHLRAEGTSDAPPVLRTQRPYTVDELRKVLRLARRLSEARVSPQWLQALRETAYTSKATGIRTGKLALARMEMGASGGANASQLVREVVNELAAGRSVEFPWIIDGDRLFNPWPELVDLVPLVPKKGDEKKE